MKFTITKEIEWNLAYICITECYLSLYSLSNSIEWFDTTRYTRYSTEIYVVVLKQCHSIRTIIYVSLLNVKTVLLIRSNYSNIPTNERTYLEWGV